MKAPTLHWALSDPEIPGQRLALGAAYWVARGLLLLGAIGLVLCILVEVDDVIAVRGIVEPTSVHTVRAAATGAISKLHFSAGMLVSEGTPLFTIRANRLDSALAELTTALSAAITDKRQRDALHSLEVERAYEEESLAQLAVRRARTTFQLALVLAYPGVPVDLDSAIAAPQRDDEINVALARTDALAAAARARIAKLTTALLAQDTAGENDVATLTRRIRAAKRIEETLVVRAPASGIILTDDFESNDGRLVQEGEPILELANPMQWSIHLLIDQRTIGALRGDETVIIELQTGEGTALTEFGGRIDFVAAEPWQHAPLLQQSGLQLEARTPLYRVAVQLDDSSAVRFGQMARRGYVVSARLVKGKMSLGRVLLRGALGAQ